MSALWRLNIWRRAHDAILLDWISHTRRPFEAGETNEELFERYIGRRPIGADNKTLCQESSSDG